MRRSAEATGSSARFQRPCAKVMPSSRLSGCGNRNAVSASLADMAADIVAGEQQVALTSGDRLQLNSLLQMESEVAAPAETRAVEAKPTRTKRTSTKPGTRKPKRDPVGDQTPGSSTQT